jgi:hypothetical protein
MRQGMSRRVINIALAAYSICRCWLGEVSADDDDRHIAMLLHCFFAEARHLLGLSCIQYGTCSSCNRCVRGLLDL